MSITDYMLIHKLLIQSNVFNIKYFGDEKRAIQRLHIARIESVCAVI